MWGVLFTHFLPSSLSQGLSLEPRNHNMTSQANQPDPEIISAWLRYTRITGRLLGPLCIYIGYWVLNSSLQCLLIRRCSSFLSFVMA